MSRDSYLSLIKTGESEYREKGSRFLGYAIPIESEEACRREILRLEKLHHSSRHVCYAWRMAALSPEQITERMNDAGEPSGTAGMPILQQIRQHQLENALVVVVRYFGGTLLGTGGLVRAYREAASLSIEAAGSISRKFMTTVSLTVGYENYQQVVGKITAMGGEILSSEYTDDKAIFRLKIPESERENILDLATEG